MIEYTTGNLLEAEVEALVNTVNTVGVMGKGIALMFKEAFPSNFKAYEIACKAKKISTGRMFVTERAGLIGPRWIVNFPTKNHWRSPSKLEWIQEGLRDLKRFVLEHEIASIALPPLGAGNGGLDWHEVKAIIQQELKELDQVHILVFEPTREYQNVAKRTGVEKLTPSRAVIAELVRRYSILGIECSLLEVQKLGYFVERFATRDLAAKLAFDFQAHKYGPYSDRLKHLLNGLDGSYLHCEKRITDASPFEFIRFDDTKKDRVAVYLSTEEARPFRDSLAKTSELIDGFESPLGMELLSTIDWLLNNSDVKASAPSVLKALVEWPGGKVSAERKLELFEERIVEIAIEALAEAGLVPKGALL